MNAAPPKLDGFKVLVAGTGGVNLPDEVVRTSAEVGRALARAGAQLLVGKWPGVDELVTQTFRQELSAGMEKDRIHVIAGRKHAAESLEVGEPAEKFKWAEKAVRQADAVVLIGGRGNTWGIFQMSREMNKPTFPLGWTGGSAKKAFKTMMEEWDSTRLPGIEKSQFSNLRISVDSSTDIAEDVDNLIDLIALCLHGQDLPTDDVEVETDAVGAEYLAPDEAATPDRASDATISDTVSDATPSDPASDGEEEQSVAEQVDDNRGIAEDETWVLVVGTGAQELPERVEWAARAVGEALARTGFRLVTCGWPGVDEVVTDAFAGELPARKLLTEHFRQALVPGQERTAKRGAVVPVRDGAEGALDCMSLVDAVVLIGGRGATYAFYQAAQEADKPVFALAGTQGDAEKAFHEIRGEWSSRARLYNELGEASFARLGKAIRSPADAEKLADDLAGIIRRCIGRSLPSPGRKKSSSASSGVEVIRERIYIERPPLPPNTLGIRITSRTVYLDYGDEHFTSPNRLDLDALRAAQYDPTEYGKLLFKSVIHAEGSSGLGRRNSTLSGYDHAVATSGNKLRIELFFDPDDPILQTPKWEYLRDAGHDGPLAIREQSPLFRRLQSRVNAQAVAARPLKVLVAISNPSDLGQPGNIYLKALAPLDVARERQIVEDALKRLKESGVVEYRILNDDGPVTLAALGQAMEEGYHVLHLVSHGVCTPDAGNTVGEYYLILQEDNGAGCLATADEFKAVLPQTDERLIVLAACQSADSASAGVSRSLGPRLVRDGTPAVIGMQDLVPMATAQLFTRHFYHDLARSGHIEKALAATRRAIYGHDGTDSGNWGIPVLFMSTADGRLFDVDKQLGQTIGPVPDVSPLAPLQHDDPRLREVVKSSVDQVSKLGLEAPLIDSVRAAMNEALKTALNGGAAPNGAVPGGAALNGAASPVPSTPLARPQDRAELTNRITQKIAFKADELKAWVEKESGLSFADSMYCQVASSLNAGKHLILIGPPGTGKTTLAHEICRFARQRNYSNGTTLSTASADWTTFDTVGGHVPTPQQTLEFRPGLFLRAIATGQWLVIDEINRAEIDKAFGELFSVLSGQPVDLPYVVGDYPVRVLPPSSPNLDKWWSPNEVHSGYDYVIHPNWRVLATMNVYDRSSLFAMSFAFMRRFAFVDVDLPQAGQYHGLLTRWLDELAVDELKVAQPARDSIEDTLQKMLALESLMSRRALGPAIVSDIIRYLGDRYAHANGVVLEPLEVLGEAFLLHAVPQLDGLEPEGIRDIYNHVGALLGADDIASRHSHTVLVRIRSLYPHLRAHDWEIEIAV